MHFSPVPVLPATRPVTLRLHNQCCIPTDLTIQTFPPVAGDGTRSMAAASPDRIPRSPCRYRGCQTPGVAPAAPLPAGKPPVQRPASRGKNIRNCPCFTLSKPVTAAVCPGHAELLWLTCDAMEVLHCRDCEFSHGESPPPRPGSLATHRSRRPIRSHA